MAETKEKNRSFQLLKAACSFLVVFLHVRWVYGAGPSYPGWKLENLISYLGIVAVPIFFMLSGATLLGYPERYSTKDFLLRRLKSVVIPTAFWTVASLLAMILLGQISIHHPADILLALLSADANRSYWYLRTLICLYAVFPVIALLLKALPTPEMKRRLLDYLIWLVFLSTSLFPLLRIYASRAFEYFAFPLDGYILYPLIGYRLIAFPPTKRAFRLLGLAALLGSALFLVATPMISVGHKHLDMRFADYLTPPVVAMSAFAFLAMTRGPVERLLQGRLYSVVAPLAALSFSVYLLHLPIRFAIDDLLRMTGRTHLGSPALLAFRGLLTYLLALILGMLLRRIPPVKKWLLP